MIRTHLEELVKKYIPYDGVYATTDIDQALHSILQEVEANLPEEKATTHEYCDAYLNHVDRRGIPLNQNRCQKEIDEDNKKLGWNECVRATRSKFNESR